MQSRNIEKVLEGQESVEAGILTINRIIGSDHLSYLDPWIMFIELKLRNPSELKFPNHPHAGFQSLTFTLNGSVEYQDVKGNKGIIPSGGASFLNTGSGVVHTETPTPLNGYLHLYQLWINVGSKDKFTSPKAIDVSADQIPTIIEENGSKIRVFSGNFKDTLGVFTEFSIKPLILDIDLAPGASFSHPIPKDFTVFAFMIKGSAMFGSDSSLKESEIGVFNISENCDRIDIVGGEHGGRIFIAGAVPLNEPVCRNASCVMNTQQELDTAMGEFVSGTLQK
ncbi:hypothetical protein CYY_000585 [Polysphondylium violaceum]|uniref:Pirin family protein n=1 Tax=Polysphondylium violaceum TaxID=133409 RepID=A0A8J4Q4J9_9MYCE|nr:hypothetical protein CYY_000585 [Polysphondylium violaceum]